MFSNIRLVLFMLMIFIISISCKHQHKTKSEQVAVSDINKKDNLQIAENTNDDIDQIIKQCIDLPNLQSYYHIDKDPNRSPLRIALIDSISRNIALKKFETEVIFVEKTSLESENSPYLEFTKIDIKDSTAFVEMIYPAEGIRCSIELIKTEKVWSVENSKLVEK